MEENVYDAERRLTQEIVRRMQGYLRDQTLTKPALKKISGVQAAESIIERRAHGEFPTPVHEIAELGKILDGDYPQAVKRWARQRVHQLRKRIDTPIPTKRFCCSKNTSRRKGPCMNYGTVDKYGFWWCKKHAPKN
jgi:hypothetical protein